MAEVINLRMARKARTRACAGQEAAANRAKFGLSKSERGSAKREGERMARTVELARRDPESDPESNRDKSS
jgi:hypothetical protein